MDNTNLYAINKLQNDKTKLAFWLVKLAEDCDMIPDIIKDLEVPDDFCEKYAEREDHTVLGGEPAVQVTRHNREDYIDDARNDYWEEMSNEDQADTIMEKLTEEAKKP